MKQFLLPVEPDVHGLVPINGPDFHYLAHVRRIRKGECFEALSPTGNKYLAYAQEIQEETLLLVCERMEESGSPNRLKLHLAVGLPKFDKLELIVRQAVETGIASVTFLLTDHCALKIKPEDFVKRSDRLGSIMKNAAQQSGCTSFPELLPLTDLRSFIKTKKDIFFLHTNPLEKDQQGGYLSRIVSQCTVLIGPEGGFSAQEVELLKSSGATALFFDGPIMRVETACLFAAGAFFTIASRNTSKELDS